MTGGGAGGQRYERAEVDLAPLLETPGVAVEAPFEQVARQGFFLLASEPLAEDPAAVSARLAGAPESGAPAAVHGTRRTAVRRTATGTHERFALLLRGARVIGADVDLHEDERGVSATSRPPRPTRRSTSRRSTSTPGRPSSTSAR